MVAQTGLGKQLADREKLSRSKQEKPMKQKKKLPKGAKRTQSGTNKLQKPPQMDTDESETK